MSVNSTACAPAWHEGFLTLLPRIELTVRNLLRGLTGEALEDGCGEAVAQAVASY